MILNEVNAFLKEILEIDDIPLELYQKVYDSIIQNIPKEQILVTDLNKINDKEYEIVSINQKAFYLDSIKYKRLGNTKASTNSENLFLANFVCNKIREKVDESRYRFVLSEVDFNTVTKFDSFSYVKILKAKLGELGKISSNSFSYTKILKEELGELRKRYYNGFSYTKILKEVLGGIKLYTSSSFSYTKILKEKLQQLRVFNFASYSYTKILKEKLGDIKLKQAISFSYTKIMKGKLGEVKSSFISSFSYTKLLKEKLELLELVPKEIIIEPGQPYYCNIKQGNTSSATYYFDLVIKMANYEVDNGTYLFEISKNENFTEILDPKYLPQKFSGEINFMTSIFNTAYYFGMSQSQDFYFRITHKCTGYKDTISTKKIKAYRNQFEP